MTEKWQKALLKWDAWNKSVKQGRSTFLEKLMIEKKYGDINNLLASEGEQKIKDASRDFVFNFHNDWNAPWIMNHDVGVMAKEFISKELGLTSESNLQGYLGYLQRYWEDMAVPELYYFDEQEFLQRVQKTFRHEETMWSEHKVNQKGEVIYTVSWYPERVQVKPLMEWIEKVANTPVNREWVADTINRKKGGRPEISDVEELYIEPVVCAILKDKQKLTYKEIGREFGWKISNDSYGKPNMCQTAKHRVVIGRALLKYYQQKT